MFLKLIIALTITFIIIGDVSAKLSRRHSNAKCGNNSTILCRLGLNVEKVFPKYVGDDERKDDDRVFWYERVPMPAIVVATSPSLAEGSACKRQLRRYIEELRNGTMWAVQMYDSSAKQPYGIIDGQTRHLGSFDQCYRIDVRVPEHIQGRYCLVDYKYKQKYATPNFREYLDFDFDPNDSIWEAIKEKGDFRRVKRYHLQMALCVPAACSVEEVKIALRHPFNEFAQKNNLIVNVDIDDNNCQTHHEEPIFDTGSIIFCAVVAALVCLVIIAIKYDGTLSTEEEKNGTSKGRKILLCYSARRNMTTIFEVSYKHRGLDTIHMLRFILMCCVICGHRFIQYNYNTTVNMWYHERSFNSPPAMLVHNGPIVVDAFFAIGGLLTCYGLLDHVDKTKRMNFIGLTLTRFLRFTPAYAFIVFFYASVFSLMGSGPHWKADIVQLGENCANTWWSNLFYLNNYLSMDTICIFQSWYLAVDFHCYLVAIAVIYVFWKCPRTVGYSLLAVVTLIATLVPFYSTYFNHMQPLFIGFPFLDNLSNDPYFVNYYVKTHQRMSAYFVGVIFGAVLYDYQKASWRIPKRWSKILFVVLVVLLSISSQFLGFQYYNPKSNPSSFTMALYASLHRIAFAASCCFIILLITVGDGLDSHYKFFSPGWVQPLSRLTYGVYLSHNILQLYDVGTVRSARTFSYYNIFLDWVPDIVYSFLLALLIAIGIEGPFRKLEKVFIANRENAPKIDVNNKKNAKNIESIEL